MICPSTLQPIVNDIAPDDIKDLINIKKSTYNFRRENQASLPAVKSTRYGLRSFRYEAARIQIRGQWCIDGSSIYIC